VVGTSLVVYPAAGLVDFVPQLSPVFIIDPNIPRNLLRPNLFCFEEKATSGMEKLKDDLLKYYI
jgi:NAD-dependent deacetylase